MINIHSTQSLPFTKSLPWNAILKLATGLNAAIMRFLPLTCPASGLMKAGFSTGQPVKLHVTPSRIITRQNIRELWFLLQQLSKRPFDEHTTVRGLTQFPGENDMTIR